MALTDPTDTLAFHQSRVLTAHRDMSDVPLALVAASVRKYIAAGDLGTTKPETEALWFYGMNHGIALIAATKAPLEPLPEWELKFLNAYHAELGPKAVRAFYYLLLICTREARHNKSLPKCVGNMSSELSAFFTSINGGEGSIHKQLLATPPAATIGAYCEALRWQFYKCSWSGGYGGHAWGKVTDCLCNFVNGTFTAEMMLDTIWTLCHNNGPIFNKPNLGYAHHTGLLVRILDVQRSGQVPEMVIADEVIAQFLEPALTVKMAEIRSKYPEAIGNYVDWEKVQALGAVHSYPTEISKQQKLHGASPAAKKAMEELHLKKLAEAKAAAIEAAEFAKSNFQIMPGVSVKKITMARAA